ncbi:MAG: twin-arginine translocase subunit TatC [Candidatus Omnitrophica bacterium]|nr:twin-arginine translocase subunit TatC [Candidatus Omnitrophota bacterium]
MYPKKLTFIDHLDELRKRILICLAAVCIFAIAGYVFSEKILVLLKGPARGTIAEFYFFTPQAAFLIKIKIAFFAGLVLALPVLFYQTWAFVVPGLLDKERRVLMPMSVLATMLFLSGALFCYYIVLPIGLRFLIGFGGAELSPMIDVETYLQFVTTLIIIFGLIFLMPIVVFILAKLNIVSPAALAAKRGYVLIAIFVIAAVVTPPDVITQVVLALPMWILFELSILIISFFK